MPPHDIRPRANPWTLALPFALACIAWFLYHRNFGLQPTVFADEWYYSKMARLMPLSEAVVPSYLYLWIFGASAACGDGFLECVRAGNLVFFVAAAPFIYLVTRRFASGLVAFAVGVFATLAPLNIYTAYFMPESTYYFGFWVLSWVALTRVHWRPLAQALALGAVLGTMSLVKVHALFLVPALCLFVFYASWNRENGAGGRWFLRGLAAAAVAGACTVAVKFGLGWLLAGEAGLSLLGPFYQGAVNSGSISARLALLNFAFINGRGHLMALTVLYGVPLALLAWELCIRVLRRRGDPHNMLHVYTLLMLGAAAGMTIVYTATLAQPGSQEGLRLHLRYYSFVLPLLCIVAAAAVTQRDGAGGAEGETRLPGLRWTIAVLLCGVLAFALYRLPSYSANIVDGPDIAAVDLTTIAGRVIVALQGVLLLAWAARIRGAVLVYLFVAFPAALMAGNDGTGKFLARHAPPGQADLAGRLARAHIAPADRSEVVVVGTDMTQIMRVQFHLDDKDSVPMLLDQHGKLAEYQLPPDKKWMVLLGDIPLPDNVRPVLRTPHYSLVRLPDPEPAVLTVNLSGEPDPRFVTGLEGLSHAEPWGRWSDAKRVLIQFAQPLPRRAGVLLGAKAYDINTTLPFIVRVGGQSKEVRLGWAEQHVGLHFDTDGSARTLEIEVPQPVSPEERGHPGDPRKLGIGISEITITEGAERKRTVQAGR